jgi:hypothetical protein
MVSERGVSFISPDLRIKDVFHHIDMGFLNKRLCLTALPPSIRALYTERARPGDDHLTVLANDHLLVTTLIDVCDAVGVPTLLQALADGKPRQMFRSTERLDACPQVYDAERVDHDVFLDVDFGKPVRIAYHTKHLVSDTGKMTLAEGAKEGYVQSIVGLLHNKSDRFEIEPLVIGAPWLAHQRNGDDTTYLMCMGRLFGEILPEDIEQFARMREIRVEEASEWTSVMSSRSESFVKNAFATLLGEPTKKDWGGESNDHFSSNVSLDGRRRTAAFLFKGPASFREMTIDMCGKRADQLNRLVRSGAEISVVQHCHQIGEAVRETLRALVFHPGWARRKYCLIDGQATFRILKAYSFV